MTETPTPLPAGTVCTENRMRAYLEDAIKEADRIRREHNGIGGVYLYLGHDGDNVCEFKDIDGKTLAKESSGRNLFEAVGLCEKAWNRAKWIKNARCMMDGAAYRFSGQLVNDGCFNTAALQSEIREQYEVVASPDDVVAALTARKDVVRLAGGCHWLYLREYRRYSES